VPTGQDTDQHVCDGLLLTDHDLADFGCDSTKDVAEIRDAHSFFDIGHRCPQDQAAQCREM